ncbi:hypothetical protein BGZ70_010349 [Mortierella alpina]|uniref:Uncharacterized protein n=1 Tax=Mortierella alpina TaxID=64518 RepID=A0A9P6LZQ5_MORAP|nr:hypothetical protein BGZ70_010349 [Mortierella alpina]
MNSLVSYASDSESDADEIIPPGPGLAAPAAGHSSAQHPSSPKHHGSHNSDENAPTTALTANTEHGQDDFVSAALKDLQTFAASVSDDTSALLETPEPDPPLVSLDNRISFEYGPSDMDVDHTSADVVPDDDIIMAEDTAVEAVVSPPTTPVELTSEQQVIFDAFMLKINAIPLVSQSPSLPPQDTDPAETKDERQEYMLSDQKWQQSASVQEIYSRLHQLSLLSSPTLDSQLLEDRLIEFAIRILDWDRGGMKPAYFMGEERVQFLSQQEAKSKSKGQDRSSSHATSSDHSDDDSEDERQGEDKTAIDPPPYAGVVAAMLELMRTTEQAAAPDGWEVVWDPMSNSYGFRHWDQVRGPCLPYIHPASTTIQGPALRLKK